MFHTGVLERRLFQQLRWNIENEAARDIPEKFCWTLSYLSEKLLVFDLSLRFLVFASYPSIIVPKNCSAIFSATAFSLVFRLLKSIPRNLVGFQWFIFLSKKSTTTKVAVNYWCFVYFVHIIVVFLNWFVSKILQCELLRELLSFNYLAKTKVHNSEPDILE